MIATNFLKTFYNFLLVGMPGLTYNPINKNILHSPFTVLPGSTYINYRLNSEQIDTIKTFLSENTNDLLLHPVSIIDDSDKDYFLSVNIYNCTSPVFDFLTDKPSTRCEINTYVINNKGEIGTIILEYTSNLLSLDPDNIFKQSTKTEYFNKNDNLIINTNSDLFNLKSDINLLNINSKSKISESITRFSDKIFYKNGLYDKLYYDSSLIHNKINILKNHKIHFEFLNTIFDNVHSVFVFNDKIEFVGGLWHNIFN